MLRTHPFDLPGHQRQVFVAGWWVKGWETAEACVPRPMKTHFPTRSTGCWITWPGRPGMLAVAPMAVRALGIDRYGIWMVASSAVSAGAIVASGMGDANIRYVAMQRAVGNHDSLCRAVRSTMGIHLALGTVLALAGWLLAPAMTSRLIAADSGLRADCLWSLRIACFCCCCAPSRASASAPSAHSSTMAPRCASASRAAC